MLDLKSIILIDKLPVSLIRGQINMHITYNPSYCDPRHSLWHAC